MERGANFDGRSEASTIPQLLIAPTEDGKINDNGHLLNADTFDAQRLVYKDGVWISTDEGHTATHDENEWEQDDCDPGSQASCYMLLLKRFQSLRCQLVETDISRHNQIAGVTTESSLYAHPPGSKRAWLQTIDRDYPTLQQVLQMNERTLFFGLQSCASSIAQSTTISHKKCCWIWTLLARTGEMGTLDHERISRVRDLGIQAGRLGMRLRQPTELGEQPGGNNVVVENMRSKNEKSNSNDGVDAARSFDDRKWNKVTKVQQDAADRTIYIGNAPPESASDERQGLQVGSDTSESDTDMSLSDGEGPVHVDAETKDLEQARARLLAQLGDRLIQSRVPPSRAEAERQRQQKMRELEPGQKSLSRTAPVSSATTAPQGITAKGVALADSDWNTMVAVDMILTVVAECYGQRDLLRFRGAW